jgi:RNA polymerase sigma-70 factor (ECF subfamily)
VQSALDTLAPLSDEGLLARVVGGDAPAFELLMRRHNPRLYRVARSVLRDTHEAEDVVQEAYVRAFTHAARFEGRSSVATWLSRIAFHEALRRRRRGLRERTTPHAGGELRGATGEECMAGLNEHDPRLDAALDALPAGIRTVVVLRLVQGLSTRETAECTRLSEANVKVMLHRGKHLLAERLGPLHRAELRQRYAFGAERCDRVVEAVFRRISGAAFYNEG